MSKEEPLTAVTPENILKILPDDAYDTALSLHQLGKDLGCKIEVKPGSQRDKIVYSVTTPKKRTLFSLECSSKKWRVKANLFRISSYQAEVQKSSAVIRQSIKATRACVQCNPNCKGRAAYVIDGETLLPCYGGGHYFKGLENSDWNRLKELIILESKA